MHYEHCHLKNSINMPVDVFKDDDFLNFSPEKIIEDHLTLKIDKEAFKNRKRSMVFIVAHRICTSRIFEELHELFNAEKVKELRYRYTSEDILATRNSVLLYKALKKDKTREVYICRNSFNAIEDKYPFMCKFAGSSLYLEPKIAKGYPNEIIDRRLYLGDKSHAEDENVIHNLGITHILNVTNNIPNTFEESKTLKVTYQRINIEDNKDVPIDLSFTVAYDFIEEAISKKKVGKTRFLKTKFDLVQNFLDIKKKSTTLVSAAALTNDLVLDLNLKKVWNVDDAVKDKMYDIDTITQYKTQSSYNQNRVLVHCAMGMSRSATMVIMYLMRKFQIHWELAFSVVKARREIVDPNEGFIAKLMAFEGKQYKLRRTITLREGEGIDEDVEFSQASESASSTSSSEDLMERKYSLEI